jgi:1,4-alpha-glucan branching enzyme
MATMTAQDPALGLIALDPWLEPYADRLRERYYDYQCVRSRIDQQGGIMGPISQGHHFFGVNRGHRDGKSGFWYREWAPAASSLYLVGDFNGWNRESHPLVRDEWGVWSLFLADDSHANAVHGTRFKVQVATRHGLTDRIPAYARRVVQDPETLDYAAQFWMPPDPYRFEHASPRLTAGLRIYEAHLGMAQEEEKVGSFDEFTDRVLPRIERLGYNAIQLMAIMEHPYYASFGYHVSNFFAVSSRFGTPEELKRLIDTAHQKGLLVLLDLVHSHSVKNIYEGLNLFDGTDYQYFHAGDRGYHPAWDSLLFDYSKPEVQRFLLSNVRYWHEEYRFDGMRYDVVTSMLYRDHGLGTSFTSYDQYFGANVDEDAVLYLQLANELVHAVRAGTQSLAEDMSGMAGMARPSAEGGLGFDYRLAMGIPDFWIKLLKEKRDDDWSMHEIYHVLLNRRHTEKHVAYAESHDQALVGDKTLAFQLMDAEMYWNMSRSSESLTVDRGIALHKLIRLLTFSLGGEAYLTFMGNEFGHPEWIDFPREGNGYSFQHARRQWSLVDRDDLRYRDLAAFDAAMMELDRRCGLLADPFIEQLYVDEGTKLLVYRRGPLVFAVNLHPTQSLSDLRVPVPDAVDYQVILESDAAEFGGQGRIAGGAVYRVQKVEYAGRKQSVQLYLPARTAQVLRPV